MSNLYDRRVCCEMARIIRENAVNPAGLAASAVTELWVCWGYLAADGSRCIAAAQEVGWSSGTQSTEIRRLSSGR